MNFKNDILFFNNEKMVEEKLDERCNEFNEVNKDMESIGKEQIQIIHIILNNFNIDDSEYRSILNDEFGVDTCKLLTYKQADELIHKLNYDNDTSYRYGYNKALERCLDSFDLETLFTSRFEPTNLELKMFRMLDVDKQKQILDI